MRYPRLKTLWALKNENFEIVDILMAVNKPVNTYL